MNYVALLRGINVGRNKLVSMAELRDLAAGLGYRAPRTYVQSGNLVFGREGRTGAELEAELGAEIERRCSVRCEVIVRTAEEWDETIEGNPFPAEAKDAPSHLLVQFLKQPVKPEAIEALRAANPGRELIQAADRRLYITFPDGIGESKLAGTLLAKHIPVPSTGRNWNTILKIAALLRD